MWLVRHLEVTRQLMLEDLKVVKQMLQPISPPEYNIVRKYVQMYHKALSNHFQDMIQQGLEGNEIVTLLQWVGIYNSPELMRHPALDFDTKEFGPLLETTAIDELQNQYLKNMKLNIMEWTKNSLTQDQK
ncbi:exocyst complex component 3-like, partial [Saccostrea cucullata]|uniref:exocyst complex component 3-like n=1 Tax=Saccostrea cuccullata TaxID=36930 RepID=UPI002ED05152